MDRRALIAVDLGAESCRVSLLRWDENDLPRVKLVHRFSNGPVTAQDGSLRWPLEAIIAGVEEGVARCGEIASEGIRSIAVDGWAVDYVRLDLDGAPLALPYCYRDERTIEAEPLLHQRISPERLRTITGLQLQKLNTLYQQVADRLNGEPIGNVWLNLPEYLLYRWGAPAVSEYTNATHTQMVDIGTQTWSSEILAAANIDQSRVPRLVRTGERLGKLQGRLASLAGLGDVELIAPACHDTASAIAGIAVDGPDDWAYISSGTWSLVGTVLQKPCLNVAAQTEGFTNLAAAGGDICFHASVNGMWMVKQCMEEWSRAGHSWTLEGVLAAAQKCSPPNELLHVDDPDLMCIGDMRAKIIRGMEQQGYRAPKSDGASAPEMINLILHSLADQYRKALSSIECYTGKRLRRIFVVGGGSRNAYLRRLTAERTGLEVICGSAESSTIGNFAVQLAALHRRGADRDVRTAIRAWATRLQRGSRFD